MKAKYLPACEEGLRTMLTGDSACMAHPSPQLIKASERALWHCYGLPLRMMRVMVGQTIPCSSGNKELPCEPPLQPLGWKASHSQAVLTFGTC